MKNVLLFAICIILLSQTESIIAQQPSRISGTVLMPVIAKQKRAFRGRIYRNRLSSAKKKSNSSGESKSSFADIIVSAHPMSYQSRTKPRKPINLIQKNAEFVPRVVAITPGTRVQFINRDGFFHNVFSITPGARFNIGRKPTGVLTSRSIYKLGETKLFCDIHAQMNATIVCLDTEYYTSVQPTGRYVLPEMPPGTYQLRIYHPDLPDVRESITVKAGESVTRNFTISR